ncbi:MAG: transporter associated domain-containing protein [Acutalibacteraceae bacterium]
MIEQLDRIPEKGDSFDFENLHVAVEETEYQRTTRVRITVTPKPEAPAEEG